jgi:hypothetical protein
MNATTNLSVAAIALGALFGLPAAAIAADGDGGEKLAPAKVAVQQPAQVAKAPATQRVSDQERQRWIPSADQLNVPGDPNFGRVASK